MNWNHHACEDCQVTLRVPAFKCTTCLIIHDRKRAMKTKTKPKAKRIVTRQERKLQRLLADLLMEHDKTCAVGYQMSNICYNLAQDKNNQNAPVMSRVRQQWDALPGTTAKTVREMLITGKLA